ncbi:SUGP1 protein, partial [Malurus elegans]|nr:SUGP1 protein [Malurus elegans]
QMQQMYDMIMKHKRAMQEMQLLWERAVQQHQHGYDSDEEVDGELGTWEHRLRRLEMDKTRGQWMGPGAAGDPTAGDPHGLGLQGDPTLMGAAGDPTLIGAARDPTLIGATVGNPTPSQWIKAAAGNPRPYTDGGCRGSYTDRGCTGSYTDWGYTLLCPFCRGTTAVDGAGFGIERPAELTKEDDEYEAFRKRMMLAYRFRPNPLVREYG